MAYCKECGERVEDTDIKCVNCGFPNANYVENVNDQFDMDTDTIYEGSYVMPGSPGYVPFTGMKIHAGDETPNEPWGAPTDGLVKEQIPVMKEEVVDVVAEDLDDTQIIPPVDVKEDVFIPPTYEETPVYDEPIHTVTGASEEGSYVPPVTPTSTQGGYTPPTTSTSGQGGYTPPPNNNYGGQSGAPKKGGIPLPAIIGGVAVLLIAIFALLNLGKGGGGKGNVANVEGVWQTIAMESDGNIIGYDRGDEEAMLLEFKKDNKIILDVTNDPMEGTYKLTGEKLALDFGDEGDLSGELNKDLMSIEFGDIKFYFAKKGSEVSEDEKELLKKSANAEFLNIGKSGEVNEPIKATSDSVGKADPTITAVSGMWHTFAYEDSDGLIAFGRDDADALILALTDDNKGILSPYDDPVIGTWTIKGSDFEFKDDVGDITKGKYEEGVLTLDVDGAKLYFYQEGSTISQVEQDIMDRSGVVNTSSENKVGIDYWPGEYIGVYTEEDFWGTMKGDTFVTDVTGVIEDEGDGKYYFEVYMDGVDGAVVSHYVDLYEDHVQGKVGKDDAWIWDKYLTKDDEYLLWYGTLDNPQTIYLFYDYVNEAGDGGYSLFISMRKVGETWDDMYDKPSSLK